MKTLEQQLSFYASYHRDKRNIATHFVGIPMIVLGIASLLSRPAFAVAGYTVAPVMLVTALSLVFYFLLDLRYGLVMTLFMGASTLFGMWLGARSSAEWLAGAIGLFVVGWAIQFVGHIFEQKKPAFFDDLFGLLVGPLFIVAEAGFALGLRDPLRHQIESEVGPSLIRQPRQA